MVDFTVAKDGALVGKDTDGKDVRYVKETDLLAVKGGKETAEKMVDELTRAHDTLQKTSSAEVETTRQKVLAAEAKIADLEKALGDLDLTKKERDELKQKLVTAEKSGGELQTKFLDIKRASIVSTYRVPVATVEKKNLKELEDFEVALKAVGQINPSNYARTGGAGGGSDQTSARSRIRSGFDALHPEGK